MISSVILGPLSLIFASLSRGKEKRLSRQARAGAIMGIIGMAVSAIILSVTLYMIFSIYGGYSNMVQTFQQRMEKYMEDGVVDQEEVYNDVFRDFYGDSYGAGSGSAEDGTGENGGASSDDGAVAGGKESTDEGIKEKEKDSSNDGAGSKENKASGDKDGSSDAGDIFAGNNGGAAV